MSIAACLLLYSFAVVVLGPRLLTRWTRAGVAPRLGITAWLVAIASVLASWAAAAVFLTVELIHHWNQPGQILSTCFAVLQVVATGGAGIILQLGLFVLTALATAAATVLAVRLARSLARARSRTHDHARMARVVGRRMPGSDAIVLDAPERLAYCVAGRPHTIVVTSGALDVLDDTHLRAVLAHERAHLTGRHHLLLATTRGLTAALPRVALFTAGATEIARLLEMCADDAAARSHGPQTVLGALLTLSGVASLPAGALGATGVGVVARAERLVEPAGFTQRMRSRLLLAAAATLLAVGPLLTGVLAAAGIAFCDPSTIY
ncbi:Zn-dependent protease with chaperone function [Amycolatopsis marina]|uniref:Zn-dependent protease with chaperone function n=1 Tax=Amycolatopsis marina TaxID=490629 RepID=A0A1I1CJK3_9PSEU|nr:M56 family metallopeptidase [Amycolatopsis marina]SFB62667.1 Zn-dependent protease with chaperone function [Amycolatopsis marina]